MDVRRSALELRQLETSLPESAQRLDSGLSLPRIGSVEGAGDITTGQTPDSTLAAIEQDNDAFIVYALATLKAQMAFPSGDALDRLAPNDLARVKVLLSFYRRVIELRAFQLGGKAQL